MQATTEIAAPKLIKSKKRVQEAGEVFTPDFLVEKMLDQYPTDAWEDSKNWLEPTCGNGQFIVAIIKRKLANGHALTQALNTTFGCDIAKDNVSECRVRIYKLAMERMCKQGFPKDWKKLRVDIATIVSNNIRHTKDALAEDFTKWSYFADRSESHRKKITAVIEEAFKFIDAERKPTHTASRALRGAYRELLALKR